MRALSGCAWACATFALLSFLSPAVVSRAMTTVAGSIANSPLDPNDAIVGYNGGRLGLYSSTELTFEQWDGPYIEVATRRVELPTQLCNVADALLDLDGTRKALSPVANTLYYAYVSASGELALSSNAPIYTPQAVNQYLSDVGLGLQWRFVGFVRTGAGPTFEDSPTRRCIINWHNRIKRPIFYCPNYVDDNAVTTYDVTSATWAPLGVAAPIITIAGSRLGALDVELVFSASLVGAGGAKVSLKAQQPALPSTTQRTAALVANGSIRTSSCRLVPTWDSEEVVEITPEFISGATTTVVADDARNGAIADPPMTYVVGWVWG